jgi:hypothetical protein
MTNNRITDQPECGRSGWLDGYDAPGKLRAVFWECLFWGCVAFAAVWVTA